MSTVCMVHPISEIIFERFEFEFQDAILPKSSKTSVAEQQFIAKESNSCQPPCIQHLIRLLHILSNKLICDLSIRHSFHLVSQLSISFKIDIFHIRLSQFNSKCRARKINMGYAIDWINYDPSSLNSNLHQIAYPIDSMPYFDSLTLPLQLACESLVGSCESTAH